MLIDDVTNFRNQVMVAVQRVGGPTKASNLLGVSNTAIHEWITKKCIPNIDKAKILAGLANLEVTQLRPVR